MGKPLVIVESPAKAKTIAGYLGPDFLVESSIGHIRDLPRNAADVPAAYKGEPWARLGVDVENGFKPLYVLSSDKKSQVTKLKSLVKQASEVYLATDEDREGESIAWHLLEVLAPRVPVKRMVFHEITPQAIARAVQEWRELDRHLVDAQEARRILDRLYGYEVSPVLWKKVMPRLSAGRVQSVATRMVVERERARMRFKTAQWWDVEATLFKDGHSFKAELIEVDGRRIVGGRDFSETGELVSKPGALLLGEQEANELAEGLRGVEASVSAVVEKPFRRSPAPPFITSTLQQEAGRKLHMSAQRAMQVAQRLYEQGYITYMRTDSIALSDLAVQAARSQARRLYGDEYVPDAPRRYKSKVKNAQEAHEAIRPAGESFRLPEEVAHQVSSDESRLYELIWKRTIASQMVDATGTSAQVRLSASTAEERSHPSMRQTVFSASGRIISFPGFLRAYVEGEDDPQAELANKESPLPPLQVGDTTTMTSVDPRTHSTQPPARFTEASLVKALEELGVGRPSTYASIITTIQDRGYIWKKGPALVPSFTAFAVVNLMERYFPDLVDYGFTAAMEDDLDAIATGREEALPWLERFYLGKNSNVSLSSAPDSLDSEGAVDLEVTRAQPGAVQAQNSTQADKSGRGLKEAVAANLGDIDARAINSITIGTGSDGREMVVRVGRYGPYLQRGEDRAAIPEDMCPDELTVEEATRLLDAPSGDRVLGADPSTGEEVLVRSGRYGPYVQLGEDGTGEGKPKRASLFKTMTPESIGLKEALELLSIPRVLGKDPDTGQEVVAHNGRFGPYVTMAGDSRSLGSEDELLTITLDEAIALFSQPKQRRRGGPRPPLKELGPDPDTGAPMVVKEGRFGPYVTDGTTNASLRRGDSIEALSPQRAAELLAERRAAGPRQPKARRAPASANKAAKQGASKPGQSKAGAAKARAVSSTAQESTTSKKKPASAKSSRPRTKPTRTSSSDGPAAETNKQ
ncbi:MAG: type I DNA topoisomerase [Actinobacteria bacterium]|nr:type I DNA topoisomerase [Actinomycetota bacterium]